jgi:RimJ/RimL family protein N-acetyltransferase
VLAGPERRSVEGEDPMNEISSIPVLHTPRLELRAFRKEDFGPFAAILASPRIGRFKGFAQGASRGQSWAALANILGHWVLRGFGVFAVTSRVDGRLFGCAGVIEPEGWPGRELTWTVAEEHWGQGYATEAAAVVRDWAFASFEDTRLVAMIHEANAASVRVAQKVGAAYLREVEFFGEAVGLYEIRRPLLS